MPRVVREWINPGEETILDFGCGRDMAHVVALREEGYRAMGYDFHLPASDLALSCQFDLVYASNVLNVQDSKEMLRETVRQMWDCVRPGGLLIVNLPTSPRKGAYAGLEGYQQVWLLYSELCKVSNCTVHNMPKRIAGTGAAPVFKLQKDY